MFSPGECLKRSQKVRRDRDLLVRRAHSVLDALLRVERGIPNGKKENPAIVMRERGRVRLFEKELDQCRKALKKLGG